MDPDGDVAWVTLEKFISGSWGFAGEVRADAAGQTQGRISSPLSCLGDQVGQVQARVTLRDAADNVSTPWEFRFECLSGETPPPPPPQSDQDQVLANGIPQAPGTQIQVVKGSGVSLEAKCANVAFTFMLIWISNPKSSFGEEWETGENRAFLTLTAFYLYALCLKQGSPALLSATDGLASLDLALEQGVVQFTVQHSSLFLNIRTPTASVGSEAMNQFVVGYNPSTGASLVAVNMGSVLVQPNNRGLSAFTLGVGQQVEITEDEVGPIRPIGAEDGSTSIAQALDANRNGTLDDAEIRQAVQYWILGQTVPGTNEIIDDTTIRALIQMWILSTPVES